MPQAIRDTQRGSEREREVDLYHIESNLMATINTTSLEVQPEGKRDNQEFNVVHVVRADTRCSTE